jgi:hypothetical protein
MSIITTAQDGNVSVDQKGFATALGLTQKGFKDRMFRLAFKQVWMEAKRLASVRAHDSGNPLNVIVTDDDLLQSARSFIK